MGSESKRSFGSASIFWRRGGLTTRLQVARVLLLTCPRIFTEAVQRGGREAGRKLDLQAPVRVGVRAQVATTMSRRINSKAERLMQIQRRYTTAGGDPFASFTFVSRTSRIANPDGSVVFELKDVQAPEHWSQVVRWTFWRRSISARRVFPRAWSPS